MQKFVLKVSEPKKKKFVTLKEDFCSSDFWEEFI